MPRIYLSPSLQEYNPFYGGGSEEEVMNLIADAMEPYLRSTGIRNPVHVILFALPDDIGVVLLGGRAEKNGRHGVFSFFIS